MLNYYISKCVHFHFKIFIFKWLNSDLYNCMMCILFISQNALSWSLCSSSYRLDNQWSLFKLTLNWILMNISQYCFNISMFWLYRLSYKWSLQFACTIFQQNIHFLWCNAPYYEMGISFVINQRVFLYFYIIRLRYSCNNLLYNQKSGHEFSNWKFGRHFMMGVGSFVNQYITKK